MNTYKLNFALDFTSDLDETFRYISMDLGSPKASKSLMKKIDSAIINLKSQPFMYPLCSPPLDVLGYRKIVIDNYIIVYSIIESTKSVNLLRCFYGKSSYLSFFK